MLLVSAIRATNQMSESMLILIYATQIDTQTYLLRTTSKDRLPLPVVNLDKASVWKTSLSFWQMRKIRIHMYREFRTVGQDSYLGANIGRSR